MRTISTTPAHQPHDTLTVSRLRTLAANLSQEARLPETNYLAPADTAHPRAPSDFDLNPGLFEELGSTIKARPSAVLIPILASSTLDVVFTQRTQHLPTHAGQISFPGGKIDADDADAATTAFREAEEEIGLPQDDIEPLGFLDTYHTRTGYLIHPLVALISPSFQPAPNPSEVSDTFCVPLQFLLDDQNIKRHQRIWQGRARYYYAIAYNGRYIWGATAGIIRNLRERLFAR